MFNLFFCMNYMIKPHPAVVFFPVALIISAGFFGLIGLFFRRGLVKEIIFWQLLVAIATIIAAIYTGLQEAESIPVNHKIKELLLVHKRNASIIFGLCLFLCVWLGLRKKNMRLGEYASWLAFLLILSVAVGYQGALGKSMVYKEGAGVKPMEEKIKSQFTKDRIESSVENEY